MTARYHHVYTRLWSSRDFRSWTEDGRHLALYLLTCPARTTEGLFRLPMPLAAHELQWTADRVERAVAELEMAGFIATDRDADLVWLVNAVGWNTPRGPKQIKGAVNALGEVPSSPLQARYLDRCRSVCPELADAVRSHLGWSETVSKGYRNPSDCSSSFSISNSTPPTPPPNAEPGPESETPDTAGLVALADQTIQRATMDPNALADEPIRDLVTAVLAAGHQPSDVLTAGVDASSGRRPLGLLRSILKRLASEPPGPKPPADRRPTLDDDRPPCPTCAGYGQVGGLGPDGRPEPVSPCPTCHPLRASA